MALSSFVLAGVMGWPVAHSLSPLLHGHWLAHYGMKGAYLPLEIPPDRLQAALRALPALGFVGCNLTIPHKEAAMSYVDGMTPIAQRVGAINCLYVDTKGNVMGDNTDGFGFIENIVHAAPTWQAHAGPIAILGAGGAARAIIYSLIERGAQEIRVVNRTLARAQSLVAEFGGPLHAYAWESREEALRGAQLLVNTTNQGMRGQAPLDLSLEKLPLSALVNDIVYAPLETPLLAQARERGNLVIDGLGMLLHQARPAWQRWFNLDPEVTPALKKAILSAVAP